VSTSKDFSPQNSSSLKLEDQDLCAADGLKRDIPACTRILLVDDNPAMLDQVSRVLESHFEVVGSCGSGEEALADWFGIDPDVIVLDISMGAMSGIEVARSLHAASCRSVIVFVTVHEDPDFIEAALGAGGSAYVKKCRIRLDLVQAIKTALNGGTFVSA
jgi:DNA-binding NarL/FixJ family response regulator